ncbi:MAG: FAD-binding oxidoreductase [Bradymonadaceae bacterium]
MNQQVPTRPGVPEQMVEELADIVGRDRVLDDPTDLLAYNADCSPRGIMRARGRRLEECQPAVIVQPGHEGDLQELIQWARRTETPLVAYGAGSGVCLGAVGDATSVIVDLKRFDQIREVDEENLYVRAEAGVLGTWLERELQRRGYTMGHYPSSLYCSSLGGYLAARSAGQYSSRYGKIEDMIQSMRVVTGAGERLVTGPEPTEEQPVRDTARYGPNLTQVFVGNEGTLGFITDATLRIEPAPSHQYYRGFQFATLPEALEAIRRIMQAGLKPAVVRLYDPFDALTKSGGSEGAGEEGATAWMVRLRKMAEEALPDELIDEVAGAVDGVRNTVMTEIISRPRLVNTLVDRFASKSMLIIGFEGTSTLVEAEADWAFDLLSRYGVDLGAEPGLSWRRHRFDASYLQSPLFDTGAFVDTMEVSTTWSNLENLYRRVRQAVRPHALALAHFSHVYPEGSSIYFTLVGHRRDTEQSLALHDRIWSSALEAASEAGGSITHHHGVGALKADWTESDHVGGRRQFEALKATFDPDGILNPGKVYPKRSTERDGHQR